MIYHDSSMITTLHDSSWPIKIHHDLILRCHFLHRVRLGTPNCVLSRRILVQSLRMHKQSKFGITQQSVNRRCWSLLCKKIQTLWNAYCKRRRSIQQSVNRRCWSLLHNKNQAVLKLFHSTILRIVNESWENHTQPSPLSMVTAWAWLIHYHDSSWFIMLHRDPRWFHP